MTGAQDLTVLKNFKQITLILGFLIISWWGILDDLANRVNSESITEAMVVYGIARSINAAVSLIQSAEVSVIVGSINPGKVFAPINDLIERFSTVMTWSISSLALQRILLSIFSSYSLKMVFTIICIILIYSHIFLKRNRYLNRAWTAFIFIAAMRFSVGLTCAVTAIVDVSFVQTIEQQSVRTISKFNASISLGVQEIGNADGELEEITSELIMQDNELRDQIETDQAELDALERQLSNTSYRPILDRLTLREKSEEVVTLEDGIREIKARIETLGNLREEILSKIDCNTSQQAGESCESGVTKFTNMFSAAKIGEVSSLLAETVDDIITVLVSMILTTIVFPLVFLYITIRIFKFLSMLLVNNLEMYTLTSNDDEKKGQVTKASVQRVQND